MSSLNLDDRQRAMLAEMGVRVWWPAQAALAPADLAEPPEPPPPSRIEPPSIDIVEPEARWPLDAPPVLPADPLPAPARATPPEPHAPEPPAVRGPERLLPLADGIDALDWPGLRRSVQQCQACVMCLGRHAPVQDAAAPEPRADWLIVGEPPDDAQERAGQPFVDDAGRLLDNMLAALGLRRWQRADASAPAGTDAARLAHLSLVLKCRPALPTAPDAAALAACAHYLRREIALAQPKVIVAMGRLAMQVLLSEAHPQGLQLPLGKLRGQVWRYQGVPVVVSYPPAYLLRQGQDKGRAWEDLCLARAVAQGER